MTDRDKFEQQHALRELASNILRIVSGGTAGDAYDILNQAIAYANAEIEARNSGGQMLTDFEIRCALDPDPGDEWKPGMTPDQQYMHNVQSAMERVQKMGIRMAAYSIRGTDKSVQAKKSSREFWEEIDRIHKLRDERMRYR
jgi:hypothetical protein